MSLEDLMDGCSNGVIYVRAEPADTAAIFDGVQEASCVEDLSPTCDMAVFAITGWTEVLFSRRDARREEAYIEALGPGYEDNSGPLLFQIEKVVAGQIPEAPLLYSTPVTAAAYMSKKLGAESIAVWGSDQGPGIGGVAKIDVDGQVMHVLSASGPSEIEQIIKIRGANPQTDDEEFELDNLIDQLADLTEERTFEWRAGEASYIEGDVASLGDAFLNKHGVDPESLNGPMLATYKAYGAHLSDALKSCNQGARLRVDL